MKIMKRIMLKDLDFSGYNLERDGITASLIQVFLACRMAFLISVNKFSSNDQFGYFYGTIFHDLTDTIYKYKGDIDVSNALDTVIIPKLTKENPMLGKSDELEKLIGTAEVMGRHFISNYKNDFKKLKNIETEHEFKIKFQDVILKGKIDLRAEKILMEHKNYSQINEDVLSDLLKFNFQVLFYITASEIEKNIKHTEFFYNINRTPLHKIGKSERLKDFLQRLDKEIKSNPAHFFKRIPLVFTENEKAKFKIELSHILHEIDLLCRGQLNIYRNQTACEGRKYHCKHIQSCSAGYLINCSKREKLFPELSDNKSIIKIKK